MVITVKATREGLLGQKTASGYVIDTVVPFVALPCIASSRIWFRRVSTDSLMVIRWIFLFFPNGHSQTECRLQSPARARGGRCGTGLHFDTLALLTGWR
jgi:hypothetical protein